MALSATDENGEERPPRNRRLSGQPLDAGLAAHASERRSGTFPLRQM